jgi:hypothetical protein
MLSIKFPRLMSFARNRNTLVQEIMEDVDLDELFILPLSQEAFEEMVQLQEEVQNINTNADERDSWCQTWGKNFTSKKFYSLIYSMVDAHQVHKMIWKSGCLLGIKFFIWLVLVDKLNTKTMLTCRHISNRNNDLCIMCDTGEEETIDHLLFFCPFDRRCWATLHIHCDLSLSIEDRLLLAMDTNGLDFFLKADMIAAWELWKIRNDSIFSRYDPSHDRWFCNFKNQGHLQAGRFKTELHTSFCFWLDAFS